MAEVNPNDPNQVSREGHAEEPQADIQRRVENAEQKNPGTGAMTTNLDPVKQPGTQKPKS